MSIVHVDVGSGEKRLYISSHVWLLNFVKMFFSVELTYKRIWESVSLALFDFRM